MQKSYVETGAMGLRCRGNEFSHHSFLAERRAVNLLLDFRDLDSGAGVGGIIAFVCGPTNAEFGHRLRRTFHAAISSRITKGVTWQAEKTDKQNCR
jgi:hypothetical protein